MTFKFTDAIGYIDELFLVAQAVIAYQGHKDESQLAEDLTPAFVSAIRQAKPDAVIDEAKLRQAVGDFVQVLFEDALGF